MAITFLHAADIHLDSPLKGLERYENAPVGRIRGATRRAFTRLIDLAIEKRVDFVLIAGDLYDGDWRDYSTVLYLKKELNRLRDYKIPVFVIAGNHDAANKMTRSLSLPDNVRIFGHDRPETALLKELDVAIHGQSFAKAVVTENLAVGYPSLVGGCLNIGLLHTGLGGADGHERYAPCTVDELRLRGYDYWALGHIHLRQSPCLDPPVVFPGNVQGRHIRESGPKGCVLVTVHSDRRFEPVFHRLDQARWERVRVELSELDTEADLLGRTAEMLDGLLASEPDPDCLLAVRVVVGGTSSLQGRLTAEPERFVNEVRGLATERGNDRLWVEKVEMQVRPPSTIMIPDGPIEELLDVLEQLRGDADALREVVDELGDLKRKLPAEFLHDPDSPQLGQAEWLRTLLDQVQPLLLDLLRKSQSGDAIGRAST